MAVSDLQRAVWIAQSTTSLQLLQNNALSVQLTLSLLKETTLVSLVTLLVLNAMDLPLTAQSARLTTSQSEEMLVKFVELASMLLRETTLVLLAMLHAILVLELRLLAFLVLLTMNLLALDRLAQLA